MLTGHAGCSTSGWGNTLNFQLGKNSIFAQGQHRNKSVPLDIEITCDESLLFLAHRAKAVPEVVNAHAA